MDQATTWRAKGTRFMHRYHARKVAKRPVQTRFVAQPEPRTVGHFARGRQLINGNILLGGTLTQAPNVNIWDVSADNPLVAEEAQGCTWLDDLAAVGDIRARACAQGWVRDWIARFGDGTGPGWTPALTGRRLIRWINHGAFLLRGQPPEAADPYFTSMGQQALFLERRWPTATAGLDRFEALAGTVIAGLALDGLGDIVPPAVSALASDCDTQIDGDGGIPTRNPEHLLEIFTLITWVHQALIDAGQTPLPQLGNALHRMAPTLRMLRHADGGLARFHGGGRGIEGRLDHALADSKVPVQPTDPDALHMGFARMNAGRVSIIADASPPPMGAASANAHASTLAVEISSGRRPLIVNCGSGRSFGAKWRFAGRTSASHATLTIDGQSSAFFGPDKSGGTADQPLLAGPVEVHCVFTPLEDGRRLEMSHDGYRNRYGLSHARVIDVSSDGRNIVGEEYLAAITDSDKRTYDKATSGGDIGVPYKVRFHLHPDVDAKVDLGGGAVSMVLKSGEVWVFRHDGQAELTLEPSVYLETGRLKPRSSQQVVLSSAALDYASRVRWSLAKAQDTPDAVRDLAEPDVASRYRPAQRGTT